MTLFEGYLLMYRYEPEFDNNYSTDSSGKDYLYGNEWRDKFLLHDPKSLPRFGHLARKVLMHYAGEHYNPHTICYIDECAIRTHIRDFILYRMEHKTPGYDWEWIDHYFRKVVGGIFDIPLHHDLARIREGFKPPFKGKLHGDAKVLH